MSLGETPGKSSWFSMLLFLVLREIFLFYEKYCERKFSVMKKLFLVSSLVLLVLFFGGCAKNGNSEPVSGISFIEEDTAAYTQGMKLVEFIPKQWEAMETAHAGKLFENAEVQEMNAEGTARYSLDYPELFDDFMAALPEVVLNSETDGLSAEPDRTLTIRIKGGAEVVLQFSGRNLCYKEKTYELSGAEAFFAAVDDVKEYGRVVEP